MIRVISRCLRRPSLSLLSATGILLVHADGKAVSVDIVLLLVVGALEADAIAGRALQVADETREDRGAGNLAAHAELGHHRPAFEAVGTAGGREDAHHAERAEVDLRRVAPGGQRLEHASNRLGPVDYILLQLVGYVEYCREICTPPHQLQMLTDVRLAVIFALTR